VVSKPIQIEALFRALQADLAVEPQTAPELRAGPEGRDKPFALNHQGASQAGCIAPHSP